MKAIVCEMCQSTDVVKQDDYFVCQYCGTKYTVEAARKMMVEGTVEVQGAVQVTNAAQLDNLISLAKKSYDSKNYAQAEEFCNQIIAMDGRNYFAWKLKGEAINYQITGENDRIEEVYNCIMTSYEVLDDAGKEEHREEILKALRVCLEGEIDFTLGLLRSQRPSNSMFNKVKKSFIKCSSNVISAYKILGYSEEEATKYRTYIQNYFIKKSNSICAKTWDEVVSYNYYRDGWDDDYHPNEKTMMTFINEGDSLLDLLTLCEEHFNKETPLTDKRENYRLQNFFQTKLVNATSYTRIVETTTNGYGAVTNKREYWKVDKTLSANAKAVRNKDINRTVALFDAVEVQIAKSDPQKRDKMLRAWRAERDSLDLSCRITGGWIFGTVFCSIIAICAFIFMPDWCRGFEWFAYVSGAIFVVLAGITLLTGYGKAVETQEQNKATYERLSKKIKEIS